MTHSLCKKAARHRSEHQGQPAKSRTASPVRFWACKPPCDSRVEPTFATSACGAQANCGALSCPGTGSRCRWVGFPGGQIRPAHVPTCPPSLRARAAACHCAIQKYPARTRPHSTQSSEFLAPRHCGPSSCRPHKMARKAGSCRSKGRLSWSQWEFSPPKALGVVGRLCDSSVSGPQAAGWQSREVWR